MPPSISFDKSREASASRCGEVLPVLTTTASNQTVIYKDRLGVLWYPLPALVTGAGNFLPQGDSVTLTPVSQLPRLFSEKLVFRAFYYGVKSREWMAPCAPHVLLLSTCVGHSDQSHTVVSVMASCDVLWWRGGATQTCAGPLLPWIRLEMEMVPKTSFLMRLDSVSTKFSHIRVMIMRTILERDKIDHVITDCIIPLSIPRI